MPCPYNGFLGKPGEGMHKMHFAGVAVADFVMTVVLAIVIALALSVFKIISPSPLNVLFIFIILWAIAIGLHYYFCVNTSVNVALFGKR